MRRGWLAACALVVALALQATAAADPDLGVERFYQNADGSERLGFFVTEMLSEDFASIGFSEMADGIETGFNGPKSTAEEFELGQRFGDAAMGFAVTSSAPNRDFDTGLILLVLDGPRLYFWGWLGHGEDRKADFLALAADFLPVAEREIHAGIETMPDAEAVAHRFGDEWHEIDAMLAGFDE